ncbi:MAG: nuclear transport factor 2 family protein [Prolixibacteraceae bacterium]|nr:nuclear transport factor 2 family protein [Prolixibacteraceae bacterium]MBN2773456.1 nuclear transport factor 2 family protein [Prolixibacteraceae bacterium]
MKKILIKSIYLTVIIFSFSGCTKEVNLDPAVEKGKVEEAIKNSIGWAKNKDINLLYSIILNDSTYIEVDPDNRIIKGFDEFKMNEEFWMDENFKAIKYEITDLNIHFSEDKKVAWFFCLLDDINEWKGEPANWENTRWTGVLEKKDNKWIIKQMHFSFATD